MKQAAKTSESFLSPYPTMLIPDKPCLTSLFPTLPHLCVVALRQSRYELVCVGCPGRFLHLLHGGLQPAIEDVLADTADVNSKGHDEIRWHRSIDESQDRGEAMNS